MPLYHREDHYDEAAIAGMATQYRALIEAIGEDADREGLVKTPERAAKALAFLTQGQGADPADILRSALFEEDCEEMVLIRDIEVFSLCEHHMLPFFGKAHVAYLPQGRITGLSKLPKRLRSVEVVYPMIDMVRKVPAVMPKTCMMLAPV